MTAKDPNVIATSYNSFINNMFHVPKRGNIPVVEHDCELLAQPLRSKDGGTHGAVSLCDRHGRRG